MYDQYADRKSCSTCQHWCCGQQFNWSPDLNVGVCLKDESQRSSVEGGGCINYIKKSSVSAQQKVRSLGDSKTLVDDVVDKIVKEGTLWSAVCLAVEQRLKDKFDELRFLDEMMARRISELAAIETRIESKCHKNSNP